MNQLTILISLYFLNCFAETSIKENDISYEKQHNEEKQDFYTYLSVCHDPVRTVYTVRGKTCHKNNQIALGKFKNAVNKTGWGIFEVETFSNYSEELQAYSAGLAEGILTKELIHYHRLNTIEELCKDDKAFCKRLYSYLQENLDWIKKTAIQAPADQYWKQVNLTFAQLSGIYHGYLRKHIFHFKPAIEFRITPIYMLQLSGELIDLSKFFNKTKGYLTEIDAGKCSGFIKITEKNEDLLFAHVAMSGYNTMNRILKIYKFGFNSSKFPGNTFSFSGYPGALASLDDFVLINSGLAVMETTISIFNTELYSEKYIKPQKQLHCWLRSIIANSLARGYVSAQDITSLFKQQRYWPSYNIPYLKDVQKMSGFEDKGKQYDWYNYDNCPRAKIFRRDHIFVKDTQTLQKLMRYNDYTHEEFSRCKCNPPYTAEASISTRGDLNPSNGTYELAAMGHRNHGAIDYKGTNYTLFKRLAFNAWGGPTYDPLPVFSWETTDIVENHYGQPTTWNFKPIQIRWESEVKVDV